MSTVPLKAEYIFEEGARPRDWNPRRGSGKTALRTVRLCIMGFFLPAILVAGPIYLRFQVYSEQFYPVAASDQRMIDAKVSTTWCQSQLVKVNATFNAYLLRKDPEVKAGTVPVTMTRYLVLEDDMKEYWGFYLLRGSSVTVSTCVRWPGASLTIIRGHKHLHECAFIGDDSSEELEELVEIAEERGLLQIKSEEDAPTNEPGKMTRAHAGVQFHHKDSVPHANYTLPEIGHQLSSHELDSKQMRNILTQLVIKTLDTKNKQKENPHHHYEGVYKESANIDRPPILPDDFSYLGESNEEQNTTPGQIHVEQHPEAPGKNIDSVNGIQPTISGERVQSVVDERNLLDKLDVVKNDSISSGKKMERSENPTDGGNGSSTRTSGKVNVSKDEEDKFHMIKKKTTITFSPSPVKSGKNTSTSKTIDITDGNEDEEEIQGNAHQKIKSKEPVSSEVFQDILEKMNSLGSRKKTVLQKLIDAIDENDDTEDSVVKKMVSDVIGEHGDQLSDEEKRRVKRDLVLSSPIHDELTRDDDDEDAAIEEGVLNPDGFAEDRGTVNETTLNDRSNSEFWSSFSSSEERLLECKGLILNLPLTPHRHCTPQYEAEHTASSLANTVTYRVPSNGYYFFVFNSENEIQPNYIRIRFDLQKVMYNTSDAVHECKNTTQECALPLNFFSAQRTVFELPVNDNASQWNQEYMVVSTCEPRTSLYMICIIAVPLLILMFAFK